MYLVLYIGIGILLIVGIYFLIKTGATSKDHEIINDDKGKKTQFNPEKVSGLMPNKQKSDAKKES